MSDGIDRDGDPGDRPRLIAMHLPQYHPIPENDAWWGKGFTEWTNVARARPLFRGHHQPHLPADLGFYDLRLPEARAAQAELAREHGLGGFCYYHYWFGGRRLLERPFEEILRSGEPDFPFCLCWANEPWSRRWLGEERDVLMPQAYSAEDDLAHDRWLARAFEDPRYIRVAGRPVFLIYRPKSIPDLGGSLDRLRRAVAGEGVADPWLVGVDAHSPGTDFRDHGFNGTMAFTPQLGVLPDFLVDGPTPGKLRRNLGLGVPSARLKLYDDTAARRAMDGIRRPFPHYPCCYVSWDNSPRRGRDGIVVVNGTPGGFARDLAACIDRAGSLPEGERLVFVNAWNEWAEGNHLEPDAQDGRAYLEALRQVARGASGGGDG
jgi:hypothetical protein